MKQGKMLLGLSEDERGAILQAVKKARSVLRTTPAVVDRVLAGTLSLDAAYKAADAEAKRDQIERDADAIAAHRIGGRFTR